MHKNVLWKSSRLYRQVVFAFLLSVLLMGNLQIKVNSQGHAPLQSCVIHTDPSNNQTGRLLIFLAGLNTQHRLDHTSEDTANWNTIKDGVLDLYEGYIYYSFDRTNAEEFYEKDHTGQSIASNHVIALQELISDCMSRGYRSIDLIGHSTGGVVALDYFYQHGLSGPQRGVVKHIITLDSPVNGSVTLCNTNWTPIFCGRSISDVVRTFAIFFYGFQPRSTAAQEMGTRYLSQDSVIQQNILNVKNIKRILGTHIYTVTNVNDLVIEMRDSIIPAGSAYSYPGSFGWPNLDNALGHSAVFTEEAAPLLIDHLRPVLLTVDPPSEPTPGPEPTQTSGQNNAEFIADVTLPDGTVVEPGSSHSKTWRLRNTGNRIWGEGHALVFRDGEQMGAPASVVVPVLTLPDETVDISVPIVAPSTSGVHRGYWQLRDPYNTYFGPRIWVNITVSGGAPPPPPQSEIDLDCLDCPVLVAPGQQFRPTIRATLTNLDLRESRGDMLRHSGGDLFGAWPHIAVQGNAYNTYDFTFYANNPITAPATEGTYESKWRVWRNGDWFGPELTIRFEVRQGSGTNHAPPPPSLTSPGDWAVFQGTTPTLKAQHNGDPDGDPITAYYFEIFESHSTPNSGWITGNAWTPPTLGNYGYQWRVKVRDSRGAESGWSEVRHFNLLDPNPQIYSFTYMWCPAEYGNPDQICFCADTNAGTIRVQVNSATDGSANGEWRVISELGSPDWQCDSPDDNPPTWSQLEAETGTHLARLYARRDGGWDAAAIAELQIPLPANRRPNAPSNRLPQRDAQLNSRTVQMEWKATLRTTGYRLLASPVSDFSTVMLDIPLPVTTTSYLHTFPSDYETVYWRVIATGPYGENEATSRFHIDITPPTSSVAALPETTTDVNFSVNWSGTDTRSGLRWYHVQVRAGNRPDSEWQDWLVNTTKQVELFRGQPGVEYFFRVRAMDQAGNWEGWPGSQGDTATVVDPTALPPTAWWNNAYALKRNLTLLNNDSDPIPAGYPIHVHFDATTSPTAAEVYASSLAPVKGDDVRLVYADTTELDRYVQRFTPTAIDLWFPLQASLGGGQTSSGAYQLYFGNPDAGAPPSHYDTVFLPKADAGTTGLWHFQEGAGSFVADSSGHGRHGSFIQSDWGDGLLGPAGRFNGSSALVEIPHSDAFRPGAITMEAWVYVTDLAGSSGMIFNKDRFYFRVYDNGELKFMLKASGGDRSITSSARLNSHQWYHVAATYDGGTTMRIYINGRLDREGTEGAPVNQWNNTPLRLGREPVSSSYFAGYIQHARISNIARTSFPYGRVDIPATVGAGIPVSPPTPGAPNLILLDIRATRIERNETVIQAVMVNAGDKATGNSFFTDLYLDWVPTGPGDLNGSVRLWLNDSVEPGVVVELTTTLTDGVLFRDAGSLGAMSEMTHTLYAQTDSAGRVTESDDGDNIFSAGERVCYAAADAYESDNTSQSASTLAIGQTQDHNFDVEGDIDWVRLHLTGGNTYQFDAAPLGYRSDPVLSLFAANGTTLLAENDDSPDSLGSRIAWTATTSGTYYLRVRHWNSGEWGCANGYRLTATGPGGPTPTPTATVTPGGPTVTPVPTATATPGGSPDRKLYLPVIRR